MHGKEHSILALPVYTRIYSTGAARLTFFFPPRSPPSHHCQIPSARFTLLLFSLGWILALIGVIFWGFFFFFLFGGVEFVFEGR